MGPFQIYLDHNATTAPSARVREKIPGWLEQWGNPSSIHWAGRGAKTLLRESRQNLARVLGADALEIVWTSGGSEANSLAILGTYLRLNPNPGIHSAKDQYIFSSVEHPSVRQAMMRLKKWGAKVDVVEVRPSGEIDLDQY